MSKSVNSIIILWCAEGQQEPAFICFVFPFPILSNFSSKFNFFAAISNLKIRLIQTLNESKLDHLNFSDYILDLQNLAARQYL